MYVYCYYQNLLLNAEGNYLCLLSIFSEIYYYYFRFYRNYLIIGIIINCFVLLDKLYCFKFRDLHGQIICVKD